MNAQELTLQQTRNLVADIDHKLENNLKVELLNPPNNPFNISVSQWSLNSPIDVLVNNFPAVQQVYGTVDIGNFPTSFSVNNFPSSFSVNNFPSSFSVNNFPSSFSVNNFPAVQQVYGTVNTTNKVQNVDILSLNINDSWVRLSSFNCNLIVIDNLLSEEIYIRRFSQTNYLIIPSYTSKTLPCVSNSDEWEIRKENAGAETISILRVE